MQGPYVLKAVCIKQKQASCCLCPCEGSGPKPTQTPGPTPSATMAPKRSGGHRQKRARATLEASEEQECFSEPCPHSPLATGLLRRWASGSLSAVDVQELANLAILSGCTDLEVQLLGSMGSRGQMPNNISRDLYRRYVHGIQLPEPSVVRVPVLEARGDRHTLTYKDLSMFLPHDWVHCLSNFHHNDFESLMGTTDIGAWWQSSSLANPKFFQNAILDQEDWAKICIPLVLHGDGARFQERDSLVTVSMKGLLGHQHLLLVAIPKLITASLKHGHTVDTWDVVWTHLCWSLTALMEGLHPALDVTGQPFPEDSARHQLAGKPITPCRQTCIVWSITGDLDYFSSCLGFPYHSANQFCWCCAADRDQVPWNDFRATASWRQSVKTPLQLLQDPPSKHQLFQVPGISASTVMFDMMHVITPCLHSATWRWTAPGLRVLAGSGFDSKR